MGLTGHPTSASHLWTMLQKYWNELTEQYLISLEEIIPQMCSAVLTIRGDSEGEGACIVCLDFFIKIN